MDKKLAKRKKDKKQNRRSLRPLQLKLRNFKN
jgi:hypothetical protein